MSILKIWVSLFKAKSKRDIASLFTAGIALIFALIGFFSGLVRLIPYDQGSFVAKAVIVADSLNFMYNKHGGGVSMESIDYTSVIDIEYPSAMPVNSSNKVLVKYKYLLSDTSKRFPPLLTGEFLERAKKFNEFNLKLFKDSSNISDPKKKGSEPKEESSKIQKEVAISLYSAGFEIAPELEQKITLTNRYLEASQISWDIMPKSDGEHNLNIDFSNLVKEDFKGPLILNKVSKKLNSKIITIPVSVTYALGMTEIRFKLLLYIFGFVSFLLSYPLVVSLFRKKLDLYDSPNSGTSSEPHRNVKNKEAEKSKPLTNPAKKEPRNSKNRLTNDKPNEQTEP